MHTLHLLSRQMSPMANVPPFADPDPCQRLIDYMTPVLPELGGKDRRPWAEAYLRGPLMGGERKSIEPMAMRLPDGNVQALRHFIGKSPGRMNRCAGGWPASSVRKWDPAPVEHCPKWRLRSR